MKVAGSVFPYHRALLHINRNRIYKNPYLKVKFLISEGDTIVNLYILYYIKAGSSFNIPQPSKDVIY